MCFQASGAKTKKSKGEVTNPTESLGEGEEKVEKDKEEDDDEEIPQLVPMATPSKKPKLQVSIIVLALISFLMYSDWLSAETTLWWNSNRAVADSQQEEEEEAAAGERTESCWSKTKKTRPRKQTKKGRTEKLQSKEKNAKSEMIFIVWHGPVHTLNTLNQNVPVLCIYPN